mmetsp:Transcript_26502/g.57618  ORF Transcript_26502/g.57618 Transcript_26502/m.57618 type:complete len:311 (+) Transcript_26502:246-1178(+)
MVENAVGRAAHVARPRARKRSRLVHGIHVGGVLYGVEGGNPGGLHLPPLQQLPVKPLEPRVGLDVVQPPALAPQPLRQVHLQHAGDEVHELAAHVGGEGVLPLLDFVHDGHVIAHLAEGRPAGHQLVNHHADGPHVHPRAVPLARDHLRGHVLRGAAHRVRLSVVHALREPQVRHLAVAVLVDEEVLELQVAVHHSELVQVLDGQHDAPRVEPRVLLGDAAVGEALALHVGEELAAHHGLHEHVQELRVAERPAQVHHEGGVALQPNLALLVHLRSHLGLHDVVLEEHLHGVHVPLGPHQVHHPVAAHAH